MRVLFDPGVHDLRNKGNVALLQVAMSRITEMWPTATLEVITLGPHLLRLYCPKAIAVSPDSRHGRSNEYSLTRRIMRFLPRPVVRSLFEFREELSGLRVAYSEVLAQNENGSGAAERDHGRGSASDAVDDQSLGTDRQEAERIVQGADLFVLTGGEYVGDHIKDLALRILDRMEAALRLGVPVVMVGQGFDPIEDSNLRARAASVLRLVDLIFIREKVTAPRVLNSLGVDPARVFYTGDDAVEMAYAARAKATGEAIGVGLRVARYTNLNDSHIHIIREVLQQAAAKHGSKLIALPISHARGELDAKVIRKVLGGHRSVQDDRWKFDVPLQLIRKTGRCRLVVAGSFHAALFALAQGIPVVVLAKSRRYLDKFYGLADQFGDGCEVVSLDDDQVRERLANAIDKAWEEAERVRPLLLASAAQQIELACAAYRRIGELFELRNGAGLRSCIRR